MMALIGVLAGCEEEASRERYEIIGTEEQVVLDHQTGLMWQEEYNPGKMIYDFALRFCEDLDYGGYSDWRLPTIFEYLDLNKEKDDSFIKTDFPDMPLELFWSSTPRDEETTDRFYVWCPNGQPIPSALLKYDGYYVRCVRQGS